MTTKEIVKVVATLIAYFAIIVLLVYGIGRAMDMGNFSW